MVKGSHRYGILSAKGHLLSPETVRRVLMHPETGGEGDSSLPDDARGGVVDIELDAGETFLCHNWTVHCSGQNYTDKPRRALSVNYMDARTRVYDPKPALAGPIGRPGQAFFRLFDSPFDEERPPEDRGRC